MRIACVGYRDWAHRIYHRLSALEDHLFLQFRSKSHFDEAALRDFNPDLVLFYGWSWIVPTGLLNDFKCLMLHPAPLPRYRGGSPIQNQIINDDLDSEVCIFLMTEALDGGDVVARGALNLSGTLDEIFERITKVGYELTVKLLNTALEPVPQDEHGATYCRRRTPEESEITLEELTTKTSTYLYNKVRMLADPYPNAYFRTVDGKRLLFKHVELADD